jgi:uncharacterized membrane protein HdeD (DUF308 family)
MSEASEADSRAAQRGAVIRGLQAGVSSKLASGWRFLVIRGGIALLLGAWVIFWPNVSLRWLAVAVGSYCLADGLTALIAALRQSQLREQLFQALLILAIGALLLFWPGATVRTVLALLGAVAVIAGFSQFVSARRLPTGTPERKLLMKVSLLVTAVGLVLAVWPGSGVSVLAVIVGIALVLIGALLVFLGTRLKNLQARIHDLGRQPPVL